MTEFTSLEIQLIRSSLSTRTNDEIAELIERPVDEVISYINEITDGNAEQRDGDVARYKEEEARAKVKKRSRVNAEERKAREKKRAAVKKQHAKAEQEWAARREQVKKLENQRRYQTRKLDLARTISVKLDSKTYALVEIQATPKLTQALIDQVKTNYLLQKRKNPLYKDQND